VDGGGKGVGKLGGVRVVTAARGHVDADGGVRLKDLLEVLGRKEGGDGRVVLNRGLLRAVHIVRVLLRHEH
jgi:hypothetical protein